MSLGLPWTVSMKEFRSIWRINLICVSNHNSYCFPDIVFFYRCTICYFIFTLLYRTFNSHQYLLKSKENEVVQLSLYSGLSFLYRNGFWKLTLCEREDYCSMYTDLGSDHLLRFHCRLMLSAVCCLRFNYHREVTWHLRFRRLYKRLLSEWPNSV